MSKCTKIKLHSWGNGRESRKALSQPVDPGGVGGFSNACRSIGTSTTSQNRANMINTPSKIYPNSMKNHCCVADAFLEHFGRALEREKTQNEAVGHKFYDSFGDHFPYENQKMASPETSTY